MCDDKKKAKPNWDKLTKKDKEKLEIAKEIGVIEKIYQGGYRNLTSKESGRIGGILASRKKKEMLKKDSMKKQ